MKTIILFYLFERDLNYIFTYMLTLISNLNSLWLRVKDWSLLNFFP
jgi:hypothetical protein